MNIYRSIEFLVRKYQQAVKDENTKKQRKLIKALRNLNVKIDSATEEGVRWSFISEPLTKESISDAISEAKIGNTITNCTFTGVQWDAKAIDTVQAVADGLLETAKAYHSLIGVLRASNVTIETMVKL